MNTVRCNAWELSHLGCFVVFDTLAEAEMVKADQPVDPAVGLTADLWTINQMSKGFAVKVFYPNMKYYLSRQDWERISPA